MGTATTSGSGPFSKTSPNGEVLEYEVFNVDRAGQATYHGPGQLIAYPILDLNYFSKDIHLYLRNLESTIIDTLAEFGIQGARIDGLTGVWVGDHKVAAIGVKLRRWVTLHGLSLNVAPDMTYFRNIVPCGISDRHVGSVTQFHSDASMETVSAALMRSFSKNFAVALDVVSGDEALAELMQICGDGSATDMSVAAAAAVTEPLD